MVSGPNLPTRTMLVMDLTEGVHLPRQGREYKVTAVTHGDHDIVTVTSEPADGADGQILTEPYAADEAMVVYAAERDG